MTTDDPRARAAEHAQLWAGWMIVQEGASHPWHRGLPCGTTELVATAVPHDPHMVMHTLEDHSEDSGHLVVHQRGGPAWLREHLLALRSWASTVTGAEIRFHDHQATGPNDTQALSVDQWTSTTPRSSSTSTPSTPDIPPHRIIIDPGGLEQQILRRIGGQALQASN